MAKSRKSKNVPVRRLTTVRQVCRALFRENSTKLRHEALFRRGLKLATTIDSLKLLAGESLWSDQTETLVSKAYSIGCKITAHAFIAALQEVRKIRDERAEMFGE